MPAPEERELILRAKEGCDGAFRQLVERFMKSAYDTAIHFVSDHDDAQDVAQEAFVRVHRSLGSFRGDAEFGTWLYRIVANLSMNKIRSRTSRARFEVRADERIENMAHPEAGAGGSADLTHHIERALHELPTLQRAVVLLRHLNGLSTREVSSILECSEGTVKTHLHRGLKNMRKLLNDIGPDGL